jgi:hypothetical protein
LEDWEFRMPPSRMRGTSNSRTLAAWLEPTAKKRERMKIRRYHSWAMIGLTAILLVAGCPRQAKNASARLAPKPLLPKN